MDAQHLLNMHSHMTTGRVNFESVWQRISELVMPNASYFTNTKTAGERTDRFQYDSTGALALGRFASAIESILVPRAQKWHNLVPEVESLMDDLEVRMYLEQVNNILFKYRYRAKSGFVGSTGEYLRSLGAFGTGVMFIEDALGEGLRYRTHYLGQMYFSQDNMGLVDTIHRKFTYTCRQALQAFPNAPKRDVYEKMCKKNPEAPVEFLHVVMPNDKYNKKSKNPLERNISSYYVCITTQSIAEESGYYKNPYVVGRFTTSPDDVYGKSPAWECLNTLNTANEMSRTLLKAGQRAVDPPLLAMDDDSLRSFSLRAGAINWGGMDEQGRPRVQPLQSALNMPIGLEMIENERKTINDAFFVTLFQIMVESPAMTATEAMLRAQEKGALLAPAMGRQQTEFLSPMIERELDILSRMKAPDGSPVLPKMPDILLEYGADIDIEYTAPINRIQRSEDGVAILRTMESLMPLAQVDPSVFDAFDMNKMAKELAEINGVPAKVYRTEAEIADLQAGRAEQAQQQQLLESAPVAGKVIADLTKAQATAQNNPAPMGA